MSGSTIDKKKLLMEHTQMGGKIDEDRYNTAKPVLVHTL